MHHPSLHKGWYLLGQTAPSFDRALLLRGLQELDHDVAVVEVDGRPAVATGGTPILSGPAPQPAGVDALPLLAWVGPLTPDKLGDPGFQREYGVCANYVAGAMANGIASVELVVAMARRGLLGFYGAGGQPLSVVHDAIDAIQAQAADLAYGVNLLHNPHDPAVEQGTVDLLLHKQVRTVSASAYMKLTPMIVQYRATGLYLDAHGRVVAPNRVFAKVSRPEVAEPFLRPAPAKMLQDLVSAGRISPDEAQLARRIPVATDITAEADSGGHTDRRASSVLLPLMLALRDRVMAEQGYAQTVRVGAAGGIGTPSAVAAAFAQGAAFVLTGSINQACVEAGTSDMVKGMLAQAGAADVDMAPAGDMFEHGAEVQVLKRGTMFAMRGRRLRALYRTHDSLDSLTAAERKDVEGILRRSIDEVWEGCETFFNERDPAQVERAQRDPRHKMALVFRWYLGLSSRWAIAGDSSRRMDAQIWCGPAIGSFNEWTRGTFLQDPSERRVDVVAANLMAGAAAMLRARALAQDGVEPGPESHGWVPRPLY
ncbi:MAG: trans-AT polyketide synthase/acyltransferase/oxidoreductase domain-containing protein [Kiritimatiellia bacterium]